MQSKNKNKPVLYEYEPGTKFLLENVPVEKKIVKIKVTRLVNS